MYGKHDLSLSVPLCKKPELFRPNIQPEDWIQPMMVEHPAQFSPRARMEEWGQMLTCFTSPCHPYIAEMGGVSAAAM